MNDRTPSRWRRLLLDACAFWAGAAAGLAVAAAIAAAWRSRRGAAAVAPPAAPVVAPAAPRNAPPAAARLADPSLVQPPLVPPPLPRPAPAFANGASRVLMLLGPLALIALVAGGSYVASHESGPPLLTDETVASRDPVSFPDRVFGDGPIPVRIVRHGAEMRVTLTDGERALTAVDVPATADEIALPHPPVAAVHRFTVRTTLSADGAPQSAARSVYVLPAGH